MLLRWVPAGVEGVGWTMVDGMVVDEGLSIPVPKTAVLSSSLDYV